MTSNSGKPGRLPVKPGAVLRRLRRERAWSLRELSKRTGLPISTLSKIENGKASLTYDKLMRISEGLDVDLTRVFSEHKEPESPVRPVAHAGRRSITRRGEGGVVDTASYTYLYKATDLLDKKFVPLVGEIKHRSIDDFEELIRHEGEEYTYVLEGVLEFHTELYAPAILYPGDSVYFDSSMGHAYVAVGDAPCRVLSICAGKDTYQSESKVRDVSLAADKGEGLRLPAAAGGARGGRHIEGRSAPRPEATKAGRR